MTEPIHELYENFVYPAMSHPSSDPAVTAVAATLGGLDAWHPAEARILEIGCCSGHNLIPLAMRWPESRFTGIDLSEKSIAIARELAAAAGVTNLDFLVADLRTYQPECVEFDYIIAHGFFSWVPDEVKMALLDFCGKRLAPAGVATISFNLEYGWKRRFPVIEKVRAIQQAGGVDVMTALGILRTVVEVDSPELPIIDDMLAKGPEILAFDDFGPINDPWPFDRFVQVAAERGLRWLGESDPKKNLPENLDKTVLKELAKASPDPISYQVAADAAAQRTFRSGVLCRNDAQVGHQVSLERIYEWSARAGYEPEDVTDRKIHRAIAFNDPLCLTLAGLEVMLPGSNWADIAHRICDGIYRGWILPRIEPVWFDPETPEFPKLDAFRLECARRKLPLVDAWHKPCAFPNNHYEVLAAMDGSRTDAELAEFSKKHSPELAYEPWLRHLAGRGMFA